MNDSMKQMLIREFILRYDFKREDWSAKEMKNNLKMILGEEPAIKINYVKDIMVNEINSDVKEITALRSISIFFTDLDDKITKMDFQLD